jgi:hypothetical protein
MGRSDNEYTAQKQNGKERGLFESRRLEFKGTVLEVQRKLLNRRILRGKLK